MSKDQYVVHDDPTMKPKTIDIELKFKNERVSLQINGAKYPDTMSAREFVDEQVKTQESRSTSRVESVEYWVNVKADK